MSEARWCDYGDHAYKAGREGTTILGKVQQVPNQWGGTQPHTEPNLREICPECSAELGILDTYQAPVEPSQRRQAIENEARRK